MSIHPPFTGVKDRATYALNAPVRLAKIVKEKIQNQITRRRTRKAQSKKAVQNTVGSPVIRAMSSVYDENVCCTEHRAEMRSPCAACGECSK